MASKETDIDRLYGLEPVLEPESAAGSEALQRYVDVECPYCGEQIGVHLDLSAGPQSYIEDCQVCCQPIQLSVQLTGSGELERLEAERVDR